MHNKQIHYTEKDTLFTRGPIEQGHDVSIAGSLLVGNVPALEYDENFTQFGDDHVSLYPAFHNGYRAWLKSARWNPNEGYSASGTDEYIVSFEDGVRIFLEKGVFNFPIPDPLPGNNEPERREAWEEANNNNIVEWDEETQRYVKQ